MVTVQTEMEISCHIDPFSMLAKYKNHRGMTAIHDIPIGTVLVSLPPGHYLPSTLQKSSSPDEKDEENCDSLSTIILRLLQEKVLGNNSLFYQYIQSLPQKISLPVCWPSYQQQQLRETAVYDMIDSNIIRSQYEKTILPLMKKYPLIWDASVTSYDVFTWAYSIVMSRFVCFVHCQTY